MADDATRAMPVSKAEDVTARSMQANDQIRSGPCKRMIRSDPVHASE